MPRTCHVDLTLDPAAPHAARTLLGLLLGQWGVRDRDVVDDAVLVLSELVTNAFVHGDGGGTVTVGVEVGQELVLWVADASPGVPLQRSAGVDAESGRGLELLSWLTTGWGVERTGAGKRVVATLSVDSERCA